MQTFPKNVDDNISIHYIVAAKLKNVMERKTLDTYYKMQM